MVMTTPAAAIEPIGVWNWEAPEKNAIAAGTVWVSPGISAERHHFYLARGLSPADRGDFVLQHEEADMEPFWVAYDDLLAAVLDGRVSDGPVVQAVLMAKVRGLV